MDRRDCGAAKYMYTYNIDKKLQGPSVKECVILTVFENSRALNNSAVSNFLQLRIFFLLS